MDSGREEISAIAEREQSRIASLKRLRVKAKELRKTMRCFCDLDNWQPEPGTGHSWVCPIHKAAKGMPKDLWYTLGTGRHVPEAAIPRNT